MIVFDTSIPSGARVAYEIVTAYDLHGSLASLRLEVLIDTEDEAQRDLYWKLRASYQERSDVVALSERYFALLLMSGMAQEEMVA